MQEIPSIISPTTLTTSPLPLVDSAELIEYLGTVNYATNERVLAAIKSKLAAGKTPTMLVTSAGGPSGTAMSFHDTLRCVLKADLVTIGSGDVDSSGIIIFLSGTKRYVTKHTTLLLHPAGRSFDPGKRYTVPEMAAMVAEDRLKDAQYASVVSDASRGKLSQADVLSLMDIHTVLRPEDLVRHGLADAVLE